MTASKKTPSAAEVARREAQSRKDAGTTAPVDVDLWGVTVEVDPMILQDIDVLEWLITVGDEDEEPMARVTAQVKLYKALCGDKYREVIKALRASNDGKATAEDAATIVNEVMNALNPES